jgi:hypothetical protein
MEGIMRRRPETKDLQIVTFRVRRGDLAKRRSIDVDSLPEKQLDGFFDAHYMAPMPQKHGFEHLLRGVNYGKEHFFDKCVYGLLDFGRR